MRKPIKLTGPGASSADVAAALGVTPERQAAIHEILRSLKTSPRQNGSGQASATRKRPVKKSASRA